MRGAQGESQGSEALQMVSWEAVDRVDEAAMVVEVVILC